MLFVFVRCELRWLEGRSTYPVTPSMAHRPFWISASANHFKRSGSVPSPSGSNPKSPGSEPSRCAGAEDPFSHISLSAAAAVRTEERDVRTARTARRGEESELRRARGAMTRGTKIITQTRHRDPATQGQQEQGGRGNTSIRCEPAFYRESQTQSFLSGSPHVCDQLHGPKRDPP